MSDQGAERHIRKLAGQGAAVVKTRALVAAGCVSQQGWPDGLHVAQMSAVQACACCWHRESRGLMVDKGADGVRRC
jgi:hypothetical protein